jgi:hypothetical protein
MALTLDPRRYSSFADGWKSSDTLTSGDDFSHEIVLTRCRLIYFNFGFWGREFVEV